MTLADRANEEGQCGNLGNEGQAARKITHGDVDLEPNQSACLRQCSLANVATSTTPPIHDIGDQRTVQTRPSRTDVFCGTRCELTEEITLSADQQVKLSIAATQRCGKRTSHTAPMTSQGGDSRSQPGVSGTSAGFVDSASTLGPAPLTTAATPAPRNFTSNSAVAGIPAARYC